MLGTAAINAAPMRVDKWPMDTVAPPDPCAMKEARSFGQGLPCSGATLGRAEKSDQYVEMPPLQRQSSYHAVLCRGVLPMIELLKGIIIGNVEQPVLRISVLVLLPFN